MKSVGISLVTAIVCALAIFVAAPGPAATAAPLDLGSSSLGSSDPNSVHLRAIGTLGHIKYTVTNVPVPPRPLVTPRACNTVAIALVASALAVVPSLFEYLSTGSISVAQLIARLKQLGAFGGADLLKKADDAGTVTGTFDVRAGSYALVTICNINPLSPVGSVSKSLMGIAFATAGPDLGSSSGSGS